MGARHDPHRESATHGVRFIVVFALWFLAADLMIGFALPYFPASTAGALTVAVTVAVLDRRSRRSTRNELNAETMSSEQTSPS
jgi:hypothetical protein